MVLGHQNANVMHHHGGRYVGIVDAVATHAARHNEFTQSQRNRLSFVEEGDELQEPVDVRDCVGIWKAKTV